MQPCPPSVTPLVTPLQSVYRTQQRGSAEKSGSRDVKLANFIRYWQRSGWKNPDKPKIFIKKKVRNHLNHQFYPVLAKIWINRGLLYIQLQVHKKYIAKHFRSRERKVSLSLVPMARTKLSRPKAVAYVTLCLEFLDFIYLTFSQMLIFPVSMRIFRKQPFSYHGKMGARQYYQYSSKTIQYNTGKQ